VDVLASPEGKFQGRRSSRRYQPQIHFACLRSRRFQMRFTAQWHLRLQPEVNKKVMAIRRTFGAEDSRFGSLALHANALQVFTREQQRKLGRVVDPSVERKSDE